jgi:hypothetical protein
MVRLGEGEHTYEVSGEDWGKLPDGWSYKEATAVAVDSHDNVYVFNRGEHPLIVFDPDGNVIRSWGEGHFSLAHAVYIGPDDSVYLTGHFDHIIKKFTPEGELLMTLGVKGQHSPPMSGEPFSLPTDVAVHKPTGDLFVADGYANARVHRFSASGEHIHSFGETGTDPGHFNCVHDIAIDDNDVIYIADRENRRIQLFDLDGKFIDQWTNFSRTAAVCVHGDLVFVGEYFAGIKPNQMAGDLGPRVSILDRKGKVLARLGRETYGDEPGRFYSPHAIDVDSKGDVYVAEVSYAEYGQFLDPPKSLRSMQKLVKLG